MLLLRFHLFGPGFLLHGELHLLLLGLSFELLDVLSFLRRSLLQHVTRMEDWQDLELELLMAARCLRTRTVVIAAVAEELDSE